jgi:hypothetical protein
MRGLQAGAEGGEGGGPGWGATCRLGSTLLSRPVAAEAMHSRVCTRPVRGLICAMSPSVKVLLSFDTCEYSKVLLNTLFDTCAPTPHPQ